MAPRRRFKMGKLVRDKALEQIQKDGGRPYYRLLSSQELRHHLLQKLEEEREEVAAASTTEELCEEMADVLEVLRALVQTEKISWDAVEQARLEKQKKKGGFKEGLFVDFVEIDSLDDAHPVIRYCLDDPVKYPEIF